MPRGGARPGAGRKPLNRATGAVKQPAKKVPRSYAPDGKKAPDAPETWPFGVVDQKMCDKPSETPPAEPAQPIITADSPLDFLLAVIRSQDVKLPLRMQAAAIAAPFVHAKPAPMGKKDERAGAAKTAGKGKFAAASTPLQLVRR